MAAPDRTWPSWTWATSSWRSARRALERAGAEILPTRGLRFLDPCGNSVEIVQYDAVQFSKTDAVLRGTGFADLTKTEAARAELRERGLS